MVNGSGNMLAGYVIPAGDKLLVRQYQPTRVCGGVGITFTDGSYSWSYNLADQDGQDGIQDTVVNSWHSRRFNLDPLAGKTISSVILITEGNTQPGSWSIYYQDYVLLSADGTAHKLYSHDTSVGWDMWGTAGVTGRTMTAQHQGGAGADPALTTTYYHGDHLGSARMSSGPDGWPTWQNTYYPWGSGYNPQSTVTHYKFTGQERDPESGLDYFGARHNSSSMGRFLSTDPDQESGFENPNDPQAWNGYSYARNNPINLTDPTGQAFQYCQSDKEGKPINCQNVTDDQHQKDVKEGVNTFNHGNIYDGAQVIGTYKDLGPDISGNPEANQQAAGMIVTTFNSAIREFGKNAAYAATGAIIGHAAGAGLEAWQVSRAAKTAWTFSKFKSPLRWANQLAKRGWSAQQITEAIEGGEQFPAVNNVNAGNPATRYVHPTTGCSVVVDNVTGEVLHVGGSGFKY